jgi:molybdenum cofactor biosynthesis protein B
LVKGEHLARAPEKPRFSVITVSTSRYKEFKEGSHSRDPSGDLAVEILEKAGLTFNSRYLIPDSIEEIREALMRSVYNDGSHTVILTGGTGITVKDLTIEAVEPLLEKRLTNFPPLFTLLSFQESGTDTLTSRALAGIIGGSVVFCLPGAPEAVRLALEKIVTPQIRHILHHLQE